MSEKVPDRDGLDCLGNALAQLLHPRHSCRAFTSQEIASATVDRLFERAPRAASWCDVQPWQVIFTRGEATEHLRSVIYAAVLTKTPRSDVVVPPRYEGIYRQRRRDAGFALYNTLGIRRDDQPLRELQMLENFKFFGAPHVAVITCDTTLGPYGLLDCGAYVSTLLLVAESLGIAAVAQATPAMQSDVLRQHLSITPDRAVVCGVSLGYADEEHPANAFRTNREE